MKTNVFNKKNGPLISKKILETDQNDAGKLGKKTGLISFVGGGISPQFKKGIKKFLKHQLKSPLPFKVH